jgi:surface antigen
MPITLDGTSGITSPSIDLTTPLVVADGGTGTNTLTANNVILGNGTSAVAFVAPGSNGNLLTSNGTTWTSAAAPAGGVTSLNGQSGAITNTDYGSIGSYVIAVLTSLNINTGVVLAAENSTVAGSVLQRRADTTGTFDLIVMNTNNTSNIMQGTLTSLGLSGTWRLMVRSRSQSNGGFGATTYPLVLAVRIS